MPPDDRAETPDDQAENPDDHTWPSTSAWLVIAGVTHFVFVIGLLHVLRPDVDPLARVTSEYAVGPYGSLMASAYVALGLSLLALGMALSRAFAAGHGPPPESRCCSSRR